MSCSPVDETASSDEAAIADAPFEWASFCVRAGLYSQVLVAAGCLLSFERYLQSGCHPLGWEESAVRFAHSCRWVFFLWVAIACALARFPRWRRLLCVISSYLLAEIINEVFWGAIVRY